MHYRVLRKFGIKVEGQTIVMVDGPRRTRDCALDPFIDEAGADGSV